MGVSSDGLVWFGVASGDEERPFSTAALAKLAGQPEPDEDGEYDENIEDWQSLVEDVLEDYDCELVTHCSYDCPMYGIALKSLNYSASRGYPEAFDPKKPTKWQLEKLKQAMAAVGWDDDETPGWQLASILG